MTTIRSGFPHLAVGDGSTAAQVKAAIAASAEQPRARASNFAFDRASGREKIVAPLLGVYLGFSVARVHERFPALNVNRLLFVLMGVLLATLVIAFPFNAWVAVWRASRQLRLVAVITLCAIITIPLGIWMSGSLAFLTDHFSIALAVFLSCLLLLRDPKVLRFVVTIYVLLAGAVAVRNLVAYFTHDLSATIMTDDEKVAYEETGIVNADQMRQSFGSLDPNDIAAVMATTFPLALWLAVGNVRRKVIWLPIAGLFLVAIIPTASRGGLLGLIGAAIVLCMFGARGARRTFLITVLAGGALLFLALAGSQLSRMEDISAGDYNFTQSEGRIAIWKRGIVWMIRRPWGYGLDNFPTYFGWLNGPSRAAHNSLIQYGVELGVAGLAAYLLICVSLTKSLLTIRKHAMAQGVEGRATVALTGHVLAMLFGCWITGFFLSNAYYPLTYMAIGIASAVVLGAQSNPASLQAAPTAASRPPVRRRREFTGFASTR